MVLKFFALIVLIVLIIAVLLGAAWLGAAPGRIARKRKHPQADAIGVCGWLGLITLGVPWIIAMVWAFVNPKGPEGADELDRRIGALEEQVRSLRAGTGDAS